MPKSLDVAAASIHLQGIGRVPAVAAQELKAGDQLMYNHGGVHQITKIEEASPRFLRVFEVSAETGEEHSGRVKKDRLVARVPESGRRPVGHDAPTTDYRAQVYAPQGLTWTTVSHGATAEAAASGRTRGNRFSHFDSVLLDRHGLGNTFEARAACVKAMAQGKTFTAADGHRFRILPPEQPEPTFVKTATPLAAGPGKPAEPVESAVSTPHPRSTTARRPLWDTGWGAKRAADYATRCARYVDIDRLQLHAPGRAEVRVDFPYAVGRGPQRAEAALAIAVRFRVEARYLDRSGRALRVTGRPEDVARYAAALPRVLNHAEQLTSWASRMYGKCARRPRHADHFENLGSSGRRAAAAYFRALAFRRIVEVLVGPQDIVVPEVDPDLPLWEQAETLGGVLGEYGWVEIREAYDPAAARQLLDNAERAKVPASRRPVTGKHGEQLTLFDPAAFALQPTAGLVVVIPCSGSKVMGHAAPAGDLYIGSLHTHARRTADALTANGGTVLVLSALHGLLTLDQVIEPYDHTWTDAGSITVDELHVQAAELGLVGARVVLLTPSQYTQRALAVWPHARTPLAHLGIGRQRSRLTALRESAHIYSVAA